jgi:hypothetical protein
LGYIVLRQAKKECVERGYIIDILVKANDRKTLEALISKAVLYFKENKCDLAECLMFTNKKSYYKALKRYGFLIKRLRAYFGGYTKDGELLQKIKNPHNWFITYADPDLEYFRVGGI